MTYCIQLRINFSGLKELFNNMTAECALQKNVVFIQHYLPSLTRVLQLPVWNRVCVELTGIQIGNKHPNIYRVWRFIATNTKAQHLPHHNPVGCSPHLTLCFLFVNCIITLCITQHCSEHWASWTNSTVNTNTTGKYDIQDFRSTWDTVWK
jgi:hypothetical protein